VFTSWLVVVNAIGTIARRLAGAVVLPRLHVVQCPFTAVPTDTEAKLFLLPLQVPFYHSLARHADQGMVLTPVLKEVYTRPGKVSRLDTEAWLMVTGGLDRVG